jgi:hypothetical protein
MASGEFIANAAAALIADDHEPDGPIMRRVISAAFIIGLAVHAGAAAVNKRVQLVQDGTKPATTVPSIQPAPDTEVIKPKTDPDRPTA